MERRRLFIDDIFIGNRHRNADGAKVAEIAKSIAEVGLMNPPAVCIRDEIVMDDGELCDGVAVLIYGRHRMAALKMNGEEYVECVVHDVDDLHAELMEIDENWPVRNCRQPKRRHISRGGRLFMRRSIRRQNTVGINHRLANFSTRIRHHSSKKQPRPLAKLTVRSGWPPREAGYSAPTSTGSSALA